MAGEGGVTEVAFGAVVGMMDAVTVCSVVGLFVVCVVAVSVPVLCSVSGLMTSASKRRKENVNL